MSVQPRSTPIHSILCPRCQRLRQLKDFRRGATRAGAPPDSESGDWVGSTDIVGYGNARRICARAPARECLAGLQYAAGCVWSREERSEEHTSELQSRGQLV